MAWYKRKLSLRGWWFVRLSILILLNLWMWVSSFTLWEVFIINAGVVLTNFCTNVHAIAMGILFNEHKHQVDDYYKQVLINQKPKGEKN